MCVKFCFSNIEYFQHHTRLEHSYTLLEALKPHKPTLQHMLSDSSSWHIGTIQDHQTTNNTKRRSKLSKKALQVCVAVYDEIKWRFWCLLVPNGVFYCLMLSGDLRRVLRSISKGIGVLFMDVFQQNSTQLRVLKHQNTKTSLYNLSKNHWIIALLRSVKENYNLQFQMITLYL